MSIVPSQAPVLWRKSSHSGDTGGDCVECAVIGAAAWRKSSHSSDTGGDCVEVAPLEAAVLVRDSKEPDRAHLTVGPAAFTAFVRAAAQTQELPPAG